MYSLLYCIRVSSIPHVGHMSASSSNIKFVHQDKCSSQAPAAISAFSQLVPSLHPQSLGAISAFTVTWCNVCIRIFFSHGDSRDAQHSSTHVVALSCPVLRFPALSFPSLSFPSLPLPPLPYPALADGWLYV